MARTNGSKPAAVPCVAKQAGEVAPATDGRGRNRASGRERMLTALEVGVKGGKVVQPDRQGLSPWPTCVGLRASEGEQGCRRGGSRDDRRGSRAHLEENLRAPVGRAAAGHLPSAADPAALWIPKPGARRSVPLGYRRSVTGWYRRRCRNVLEPIFERDFAAHSYGFRPKEDARTRCAEWSELLKAGYVHMVDADLKSYFDTIPHRPLLALSGQEGDGRPRAGADRGVSRSGGAGECDGNGPPRRARRRVLWSVRC